MPKAFTPKGPATPVSQILLQLTLQDGNRLVDPFEL